MLDFNYIELYLFLKLFLEKKVKNFTFYKYFWEAH